MDQVRDFCERSRIKGLSLFGSVLRDDFTPESDVDVLVEFAENAGPGLFGLERMQRELSQLFSRKVDLNIEGFVSKYFRDPVLAETRTIHVAA